MDYESMLQKQRAFFLTDQTKDAAFRRQALLRMGEWIRRNDTLIMDALKQDLNKAPFESYAAEIGVVLDELRYAARNLGKWSRPRREASNLKNFPSRCFVMQEPYGVVLIMSPWNYPFMLTIGPLIGALAAGNCAVVKPSAYSPRTSDVVAKMIGEVFTPGHVATVLGGRKENETLLAQRFDYICFTGSVAVGKVVMEAASKHLTPVTLELGGKSPCIVDETADVRLAARRIVWGKYLNAGQTCVAPDYLLVHERVKDRLLSEIAATIKAYYSEKPCENADYPRIVNEKHFARLLGLLENENVLVGGGAKRETLQIEPTVVDGVTWDSPIMREEIFGPLLPVMTFGSLDDVIDMIRAREKPLALYLFTSSGANEKRVLRSVSFGGGCVNDTIVHLSVPRVPFGGVGNSGMGNYHGKDGFNTFTHPKSILKKSRLVDVPLRYPPYKDFYFKLLKKL